MGARRRRGLGLGALGPAIGRSPPLAFQGSVQVPSALGQVLIRSWADPPDILLNGNLQIYSECAVIEHLLQGARGLEHGSKSFRTRINHRVLTPSELAGEVHTAREYPRCFSSLYHQLDCASALAVSPPSSHGSALDSWRTPHRIHAGYAVRPAPRSDTRAENSSISDFMV